MNTLKVLNFGRKHPIKRRSNIAFMHYRSVAFIIATIIMPLLLVGAACGKKPAPVSNPISNPPGALSLVSESDRINKQVRLVTSKGTIIFTLNGSEAPIAVSNFITLTNKKFYDGLTFHRFAPNFVIQGGDPEGTGMGGPGYKFIDEPVTQEYVAGTVAMANAGPNTNGSQFFIVLEDQPNLPKSYTIFGQVTSGLEIVRQLRQGDTMTTVAIEAAAAPE